MIGKKNRCYLCGRSGHLHIHHCIHGSGRRKKATKYGLMVMLCPDCHRRLHDYGEHDRELEKLAQMEFEKVHGHDEWMREFERNYL